MDAATLAKMSPEEKEAFHRECETKVKTLNTSARRLPISRKTSFAGEDAPGG